MTFTTLNKILDILDLFCQQHAQVNEFGFGEISTVSEVQQEYPLVWCDVSPSAIDQKTLQLNLSIYALDMQKDNMVNERDTISDTLSIAQDIFALFSNPEYQDNFILELSAQLDIVREGLPDKVNGWKMDIVLNLEQTHDRCQIPTK